MLKNTRRKTISNIIEDNLDYFVRFAYYRLGNREEAEDLVYDAVLRFLEKKPDDIAIGRVRSYLFKMVYNHCLDRARAKKRVSVSIDRIDIADITADTFDLEDADRINACIGTLPPREADIIRMNVVDNLSFVEISGILSIPQSTVKSRYRSGMDKLRKLFINKMS